MKVQEDNYEEMLAKEQKRRRIKIFRHSLGFVIMVFFVFYIYFSDLADFYIRLILMIGAVIYANYELYRLIKHVKAFLSLTDELHFEDGEIIKYNPDFRKTKKWIPIESVEKVYFNIIEKPNSLFVVYKKDGYKFAESFYKQRIKDREEVMEVLKERDLIRRKSISFQDLKDEIEQANS